MLDEINPCHDSPLEFGPDSPAANTKGGGQEAGRISDMSKVRGQLMGMMKDLTRFFGRKIQLYTAINLLSNKQDRSLLVIQGKGCVGKKRLMQEICQFFHMHNKFRHVIFFEDLSKIGSETSYKLLLNKL